MAKKKKYGRVEGRSKGKTFLTQAISQADSRQAHTQIALPDDDNVTRAKNWVDFNEK